MRQLDGITYSMDMNLSKHREIVEERLGVLQSMGLPRVRHDLETEQQQPGSLNTLLFFEKYRKFT